MDLFMELQMLQLTNMVSFKEYYENNIYYKIYK
jgi:hypothetical protein